jgi:probable F420-dependent oxidoreductase
VAYGQAMQTDASNAVRLGAMFSHGDIGNDPGVIRDFAQGLEGVGIDFLAAPEHVIGGHPDRLTGEALHTYDKPYHEPFVLFGFIAGATRTLELATSILVLPQRQTVLVAKQAAELDLLCGGRLRLGVGVGRNWMEYEALDQTFTDRGARLEEQIEVLRRLWSDELVTFDGRWHHLDRMGLNPMPVQRPIPIWMGSFVGKIVPKVLDRIGRMADGWMPQVPPGDEFAAALTRVRDSARAAGRDPSEIGVECSMRLRPNDDPADWLATARAYRDHGATRLKALTPGLGATECLGLVARWAETIRAESAV